MIKKIISSLGIIAITSVASFASYSAIIDYSKTNLDAANNLAKEGIINDHSSDPENYNLDSPVLRQEIAAVARGVAGLDKKDECDNIFDDLSATNPNTWACVNVEPLVDNDLIASNDNFNPESNITKSETIAMLIKAIGFDYEYNDDSKYNWQEQVVGYAINKGVVESFSDFDTEATRGWVFMVADTTIKKDKEIKIEKLKEQGLYSDEAM